MSGNDQEIMALQCHNHVGVSCLAFLCVLVHKKKSLSHHAHPLTFCFLLISSFVRFLCYLRIFGAENYHFNGICNILEFESIILHGICNILVLLAHLGLVDGSFGVGLVQGWFRVYLGLV